MSIRVNIVKYSHPELITYPRVRVTYVGKEKSVSLIFFEEDGALTEKKWKSFEEFSKNTREFALKQLSAIYDKYLDVKTPPEVSNYFWNLVNAKQIADRIDRALA